MRNKSTQKYKSNLQNTYIQDIQHIQEINF